MSLRLTTWCFCLLVLCTGCQVLQSPPSQDTSAKLPTSRISKDAVVLEIASVRLPLKDEHLGEEFWTEVDEQHLPTELRRRLAQNGIRCGLLGSQIPTSLRQLLDNASDAKPGEYQGQDGSTDKAAVSNRRMPSRAGHRGEIVTSTHEEKVEGLTVEDGRVIGRSYDQGQCKLAVITYPQGNGQVQLELTPELHYGPVQQRWGAEAGSFRYEVGQKREVFDKLNIRAMIAPGQTLLITCSSPIKGLGKQFFTEQTNGQSQKKLLLIRLAQTQYNDLFAPEQSYQPLVTPGQ